MDENIENIPIEFISELVKELEIQDILDDIQQEQESRWRKERRNE